MIDLVAAIPFDLLLFGSDTDEVRIPCNELTFPEISNLEI